MRSVRCLAIVFTILYQVRYKFLVVIFAKDGIQKIIETNHRISFTSNALLGESIIFGMEMSMSNRKSKKFLKRLHKFFTIYKHANPISLSRIRFHKKPKNKSEFSRDTDRILKFISFPKENECYKEKKKDYTFKYNKNVKNLKHKRTSFNNYNVMIYDDLRDSDSKCEILSILMNEFTNTYSKKNSTIIIFTLFIPTWLLSIHIKTANYCNILINFTRARQYISDAYIFTLEQKPTREPSNILILKTKLCKETLKSSAVCESSDLQSRDFYVYTRSNDSSCVDIIGFASLLSLMFYERIYFFDKYVLINQEERSTIANRGKFEAINYQINLSYSFYYYTIVSVYIEEDYVYEKKEIIFYKTTSNKYEHFMNGLKDCATQNNPLYLIKNIVDEREGVKLKNNTFSDNIDCFLRQKERPILQTSLDNLNIFLDNFADVFEAKNTEPKKVTRRLSKLFYR